MKKEVEEWFVHEIFQARILEWVASPFSRGSVQPKDGETMETVADFIFLDSKIAADGDCSHVIKRHLLLGRKTMTSIDSVLKSRDVITLPTKFRLVKAMLFPVVMYGCENQILKKAER